MNSPEEREILDYLSPLGKQFASAKEICRRAAGKTRYSKNPDWAKPFLKRMEKKGMLEVDSQGHYRLKRRDEKDANQGIPLDPRIRQILAKSGKDFSKVFTLQDPTESDPTKQD